MNVASCLERLPELRTLFPPTLLSRQRDILILIPHHGVLVGIHEMTIVPFFVMVSMPFLILFVDTIDYLLKVSIFYGELFLLVLDVFKELSLVF